MTERRPETSLDHGLLVRRHAIEVARFRALAQRVTGVLRLCVEHENDGSCCRAEEWQATVVALLSSNNGGVPGGAP